MTETEINMKVAQLREWANYECRRLQAIMTCSVCGGAAAYHFPGAALFPSLCGPCRYKHTNWGHQE